ncbi:MAG: ATP-binding protein [Actinobacteria bacterium]|nr:ATP-binding protein [Actinomycetota bacterium]
MPAEPASAAAARRHIRELLDAWDAADFEDAAVLLTSELVTNALLHARSAAELHVRLADGRLRVGVTDATPVTPVRKRYGKEAATGRGLLLIETMASAWGTEPVDGGKVVWFELGGDADAGTVTSAEAVAGSPAAGPRARPGNQTTAASPDRRRPPGGGLRASERRARSRVRRAVRP